jgi:flagellar protein FlaF
MAVAELIGAAIGTLLLIVVAYLLVGNVLATSEIVANAQKDLTLVNEIRLRTGFDIEDTQIEYDESTPVRINFTIKNTGNEIISDFIHMDVFTHYTGQNGYEHYSYQKNDPGTPGIWTIEYFTNDFIHPYQLDPGETMKCNATIKSVYKPEIIQISTNNGVFASKQIP